MGDEVFKVVSQFFNEGVLLKEMNQTNVTLISKVNSPEAMHQFRPISLCRFVNKIISKVLTNRLHPFIGTSDRNSSMLSSLVGRFKTILLLHMICSIISSIRRRVVKLQWQLNLILIKRTIGSNGTFSSKLWGRWGLIVNGLDGSLNVLVRFSIISMPMEVRYVWFLREEASVKETHYHHICFCWWLMSFPTF